MVGIKPAEAKTASAMPQVYRKTAIPPCTVRTRFWMSNVLPPDWPSSEMVARAPSTKSIFMMKRKKKISAVDRP